MLRVLPIAAESLLMLIWFGTDWQSSISSFFSEASLSRSTLNSSGMSRSMANASVCSSLR